MRVDPAHQNEHRVKPRGVSPDTVETLEAPWTRHRTCVKYVKVPRLDSNISIEYTPGPVGPYRSPMPRDLW